MVAIIVGGGGNIAIVNCPIPYHFVFHFVLESLEICFGDRSLDSCRHGAVVIDLYSCRHGAVVIDLYSCRHGAVAIDL